MMSDIKMLLRDIGFKTEAHRQQNHSGPMV